MSGYIDFLVIMRLEIYFKDFIENNLHRKPYGSKGYDH